MPNYFRKKLHPIFSFLDKKNPKLNKTRTKKPSLFTTLNHNKKPPFFTTLNTKKTTLDQMSSQQQMKEVFTLFDTDKDGKIAPSELGLLMRSLGGNPTQSQLKSIISEENLKDPFGFEKFVELIKKHLKTEHFDEKLRDAFKVLDRENCGFVNVKELKHVLTSIGEKLEVSEFDEWVKEVDVDADGKIKYEDFAHRMLGK